jgi:DNA-binding PadR family transcriptional regulator
LKALDSCLGQGLYLTVLCLTLLGMCCPRDHHTRHRPPHHSSYPERGWIQFLLLRLLHEEPMHGYQLMGEMESRGYCQPGRFKTGSIYTILRRMENRGLLESRREESETGRERLVYSLTEAGEESLRRGLEGVIRRKRIMDELTDYYDEHFEGGRGGAT